MRGNEICLFSNLLNVLGFFNIKLNLHFIIIVIENGTYFQKALKINIFKHQEKILCFQNNGFESRFLSRC